MGKYEALANEIVKQIGGKENVSGLTHCITRLRFKLKDESKANDDVLKNMDGVVTVMKSGGQYQVVIGNHVADVYADVCPLIGLEGNAVSSEEEEEKKSNLIDIVSNIFQPILGVMSACGMLKGLNALFVALGLYTDAAGIYTMLNGIGDALFMFLPMFLGYTSAKKFGLKPMLGLAIGAAMCYPALQGSTLSTAGEPLYTLFTGTVFESDIHMTFLGLPMIAMDYTSTVIPVIFIVYFASKCEKFFSKFIPDLVKFFFVPMLVLLVALPVGFLLIGPVTTFGSMLISQFVFKIREFSPLLAGTVVGGTWQILVIFGMHWGFIPVYINNMVTLGYDNIMMPFFGCTFATAGVVLAIFCKSKDKKMKQLALPNFISSIFGVTEPAIYGITLPMKKPFIISCIVGAIIGGYYGHFNFRKFFAGGMGIFEFPAMINPDGTNGNIIIAITGAVFAVVLAFVMMFVAYREKETIAGSVENDIPKTATQSETPTQPALLKKEVIASPLKGNVLPLTECKDEAFAMGILGKGVVIVPEEGKVVSPVNGTLTTIFPTLHAMGITSDDGVELLIHIGMNTVELNGKHFTAKAKQGDKISVGDVLVEFDKDAIVAEGYSIETPVLVTNADDFLDMIATEQIAAAFGDTLITIMH